MVAFAQTFSSRATTLYGLESFTSDKNNKIIHSDILWKEKGNTISEKDDEDNTIISYYGNNEDNNIVSLDDIIQQQFKFRENKLYELLIRSESTDFLEAISIEDEGKSKSEISSLIFKSDKHLHTFAELVTEDLIKFAEGRMALTPLCQRMITAFAEEWEDD